jgi:hypothetical protein
MNQQLIYKNTENEMRRNIKALYSKSDSPVIIAEIIEEAAFCLALNNLLSAKQLTKQTGIHFDRVPESTMNIMIEGMDLTLKKFFKNNITDEHLEVVRSRYKSIINSSFAEEQINSHYDELYGYKGGNVI